jgi:hypothetical protein
LTPSDYQEFAHDQVRRAHRPHNRDQPDSKIEFQNAL